MKANQIQAKTVKGVDCGQLQNGFQSSQENLKLVRLEVPKSIKTPLPSFITSTFLRIVPVAKFQNSIRRIHSIAITFQSTIDEEFMEGCDVSALFLDRLGVPILVKIIIYRMRSSIVS